MSRVTYTNVEDTPEQAGLREAHRVRIVTDAEEGSGLNRLPNSVYGFTYSPGIDEAPLFTKRSFRSYEAHKLANGEVTLVGFTSAGVGAAIDDLHRGHLAAGAAGSRSPGRTRWSRFPIRASASTRVTPPRTSTASR